MGNPLPSSLSFYTKLIAQVWGLSRAYFPLSTCVFSNDLHGLGSSINPNKDKVRISPGFLSPGNLEQFEIAKSPF